MGIGRLDILHGMPLLSQYLAQPRVGHIPQPPRERARLAKAIFPDVYDTKSHNMSTPLDKPVDISIYLDADHMVKKLPDLTCANISVL